MKMKDSLQFLISLISVLLAVSTLVRASNPFGFSNDELSKIAKLELSDRTPILNSLVHKVTDRRNWCCAYGLHSCSNQICCPGFLQVANECIYIEDLIPAFLQILKELLDIGVIEICGGTGILTFPTKSPTTTTESENTIENELITSRIFTRPSSTASTTTVASTTTTSRFTYPTTTTKTTTTKKPLATVYECNFDKDNCGAQFNAGDDLDFTSLLRFQNKTITDVTSITKQTGTKPTGPYNGPVCNIPWQQPNQLNYFCSVNHECLAGEPGNQALYYCQNGRFAWTNAHQKHTSFKRTFKLNSISLSQPGVYRIVFWAFLKCQRENCGRQELDDSITVTVDDKMMQVSQEVSYFRAGDREGWQMYDFNYFTETTSIDITVDFERRIWSQIDALFAIDEISIIRI